MSVTQVPLRPIAKGSMIKLWLAVAALIALAFGVAYAGAGQFKTVTVETVAPGQGPLITEMDGVLIEYTGRDEQGTVFDSTEGRGPAPMLVMGVMPILAPLLGGQAVTLGSWRTVFYMMSLAGVVLWLAVALRMRESLDPARRSPLAVGAIAAHFRLLLTHRRFMGYTLAGGFGSGGLFAYISGSPQVFITIYGIDPRWFGLLFGLNAAALIVAAQVSARLLNRHPPLRLLNRAQGTLVLMTLCALALTLLDWITLPLLMLCLMGFMASQGFVGPNAAALALADQGPRLGVASALMGALQMLCGALAGFAVSAWHTGTPLPLTASLAACAALSWFFGRIAMRPVRQPA